MDALTAQKAVRRDKYEEGEGVLQSHEVEFKDNVQPQSEEKVLKRQARQMLLRMRRFPLQQFGTLWKANEGIWHSIKSTMTSDNWLMYEETSQRNLWTDPTEGSKKDPSPLRYPPLGLLWSWREKNAEKGLEWEDLENIAAVVDKLPGLFGSELLCYFCLVADICCMFIFQKLLLFTDIRFGWLL